MKFLRAVSILLFAITACEASKAAPTQTSINASARPNLYACEGCDAIYERKPESLSAHAIIAPPLEPGERMIIDGTVFQTDGITPAPDIVVYIWQTNADGLYANGSDESALSRQHGRLRGWIKTGADGRYSFETIKPAPYPNDTIPAHVHPAVLEPGRRPYYIDDVVFSGEFGVTDVYRKAAENRGGNGIISLQREAGIWRARRDIILERHP